MKKILLSLSFIASLSAGAQMKEGKVVYERTTQLRRNMTAAMRTEMTAEMGSAIPQARKDNFELLFGNNQSLWQTLQTAEEPNNTFSGTNAAGQTMTMRMMIPNEVIHFNFDTKKRTDQREMFEREYLVDDSIRSLSWKLSDETKTILGHPVRKAITQRISTRTQMSMENGEMKRQEVPDTAQIVAWFATDIPVSAGPSEFQGQLPGLILELDMNKGRTVYTALEISPKVKVSDIKEPKKGKRVTAAAYTEERNKLMEEMRKNMPAGNSFMIRN